MKDIYKKNNIKIDIAHPPIKSNKIISTFITLRDQLEKLKPKTKTIIQNKKLTIIQERRRSYLHMGWIN